MIDEQYFRGFPFPWLLRSSTGALVAEGPGCLFLADPRALDKADREHLLADERSLGWTRCPSGFAAFFASISEKEDIWLVIYSLKVFGVSSAQGKQRVPSMKLLPGELESYVSLAVSALERTKDEVNRVMRNSIHEVRSINSDIYNAVYELRRNVTEDGYRHGRDMNRIRNIEELSELLRTRTDVLDVLSNPTVLSSNPSRVPIYRAFDRIVRSLTPTATAKSVKLNLLGESRGHIRSNRFFDVVPYLVIQNAIKYAPQGSVVNIEFSEVPDKVMVVVASTGPLVLPTERDKLFLSGFRGKNAKVVSHEGTGIGLHLLKRLVEIHDGGAIDFVQGAQTDTARGVPYVTTHVSIAMMLDNGGGSAS